MQGAVLRVARTFLAILAMATLIAAQNPQGSYNDPNSPPPTSQGTYNDQRGQAPQSQNIRVTQGPTIQYADDVFAVITWSTNVPADSRVYYGTDASNLTLVAEAPGSGTSHRVDVPNLTPNTTYYFQVDIGQPGNIAPNEAMMSFQTVAPGAPPLHNQHPVQVSQPNEQYQAGARITSGPTIQYADANSAVISWSTDEATPSIVYYGTDAGNLAQTSQSSTDGTFHRVHLSNLAPQTNYYFSVDSGQGRGAGPVSTFQTVAAGAPPLYDQKPQPSQPNPPPGFGQRRDRSSPSQGQNLGAGLMVPNGTEIHAALDTPLSSRTSHPGEEFTATVTEPVRASNGALAIPAGTKIRGQVTEAEEGKTLPSVRGRGKLNMRFVDMTLPDRVSVPLEATLASVNNTATGEEGEVTSKTKGSTAAKDVGIGAGLGTVAGLIFGSALKGLLIGAVAGGGYVLATKGKDVDLPAKTGLALRLDHDLTVPAGIGGAR